MFTIIEVEHFHNSIPYWIIISNRQLDNRPATSCKNVIILPWNYLKEIATIIEFDEIACTSEYTSLNVMLSIMKWLVLRLQNDS